MAQKSNENSEQLVIDLTDELCSSVTSYAMEAVTSYQQREKAGIIVLYVVT